MPRKINLNPPANGKIYNISLRIPYTENIQWFQNYCILANIPLNTLMVRLVENWVEETKKNVDLETIVQTKTQLQQQLQKFIKLEEQLLIKLEEQLEELTYLCKNPFEVFQLNNETETEI